MENREKYKIGLVQMSMSASLDANLKRAVEFVREAAGMAAAPRKPRATDPANAQPVFAPLATRLPSSGTNTSFTHTNAPGLGPWSYRVGVEE